MELQECPDLTVIATVRRWCITGRAREIRTASGLSKRQMAQLVETTPATVSRWENQRRLPAPSHAERYYAALVQLQNLTAEADSLSRPDRTLLAT